MSTETARTAAQLDAIVSPDLRVGDCRELVPTLGQFDFVFADPPFNIGHGYNGYDDRRDDFDQFTAEWIEVCWNACDGVMALHGPDDLVEQYLMAARRLNMRRIAWVNWHYRFGQCGRGNWIDARCHCLLFAKRDDYTWNPDDVLVESDRVKYGDKRIDETERGGMRLPGTVWGAEIENNLLDWELLPIPEYPGYFASYDGRILSCRRRSRRWLSQSTNQDGYLRVTARHESGSIEKIGVHRLVCTAFHGEPEKGQQVRHLDGVRTNNCAANLAWGTAKDNAADRSVHGMWTPLSGERHPMAKLTKEQAESVFDMASQGVPYSSISDEFGVSKSQVSRIATRARWAQRSVIGVPSDGKYIGRVQGNSAERRKGHPNQLPELYMERLLKAYTNRGDRVLDPFAGSGTTAVVASALGRECVTIDVSDASVASVRDRVAIGAIRVEG